MVLEKRVIAIPVGSMGMDSSKNPQINPNCIQIMNANYDTDGVISKRDGSEKLVLINDNYNNLATFKDNIVAWGKDAYFWNGSLNEIDTTLGTLDIQRGNIPNSVKNVAFQCDYADLDDIYVVSYNTATVSSSGPDGYGLYIESFSKSLNRPIAKVELQADTGSEKRFARLVKMTDQNKIQYYWSGADGYVETGSIDGTGSISSSADISGLNVGKTSETTFDACYLENNGTDGYVILAYPRTLGRLGIVSLLDGDTVVHQETHAELTTSATLCASIWRQTSTSFCVASVFRRLSTWSDIVIVPYNLTFDAGYTTPQSISYAKSLYRVKNVTGVSLTDISARIYYTLLKVPTSAYVTDWLPQVNWAEVEWSSGNTFVHSDEDIWQNVAQVALKPIIFDDNEHLLGTYLKSWGTKLTAQDQLTFLNKEGKIVGRSLVGIARADEYGVSTQYDDYGFIPQICGDGYSGTTAFPWIRRLSTDDTQQRDKFQLAKLDLTWNTKGNSFAETPKTLIMANSMPYEYNGSRIMELGFPLYPEKIYGDGAPGLGAMTSNKTYKYVALYEETDDNGIIHRSAPTPTPLEVIMGASDNGVNLTVPISPFRRNNSYTVIYRTTADGDGEYFRVLSVSNDYPYLNYVQVSDGLSDANLTDNEPLYTDFRELENTCALPHRVSCVWQNRYFYVDRDNESTRIYYSKLFNPDFSTSFNDALYFTINNDGGNITALFPLSNKLIIFKKQRIYATSGSGYDNTGNGSNFSEPWIISPSIGCINKRSLIGMPDGVIFQSERGIWSLNQNEQLSPIGEPIKQYSYNDWNIIGTGATHNRHEIQLIAEDGYSVSYNWMNNKWAAISNRDGYSAAYVNNKVYWVDRNNYLNSTNQDLYTDDGQFYPLRIDTGWISFSGIGGFQRVWNFAVLGYKLGNHKLRVKVAYDFDPYWKDDTTYDPAALTSFSMSKYYDAGLGISGNEQAYHINCPTSRQKCSSIRISIEDVESGTIAQGAAITAIVFEYGVYPQSKPIGDARTNSQGD